MGISASPPAQGAEWVWMKFSAIRSRGTPVTAAICRVTSRYRSGIRAKRSRLKIRTVRSPSEAAMTFACSSSRTESAGDVRKP